MSQAALKTVTPEMLSLLARDFALHCRTLRQMLKMSQSQFGAALGVDNQQAKVTVSRWENGKHVPKKKYLLKFLKLQDQKGRL
jgi:DNA-binding transcriptional regulator YiaG